MPYGMSTTIQAIVIGDNVYVGGGSTLSVDSRKCFVVMLYSLASGSWNKLPPHKFGMTAVNNQLVLVGGSTSVRIVELGNNYYK